MMIAIQFPLNSGEDCRRVVFRKPISSLGLFVKFSKLSIFYGNVSRITVETVAFIRFDCVPNYYRLPEEQQTIVPIASHKSTSHTSILWKILKQFKIMPSLLYNDCNETMACTITISQLFILGPNN